MAAIANASSFVKLSLFVVVVALVGVMSATADTSCNSVYSRLMPCMGYVTGGGVTPPSDSCCSGIKGLKSGLKLQADRQSACRCLKDLGSRYAGAIDFNIVKDLPQKCGVSLPYKISPSIDCSTVH
ncbi:non-specific lipid-transfer protein 1-like [Nymphaea colorata]|uniref:non-specific lipid-transfer protein 1-like n=1 Tax=Nymphaea colorata TaxID=210225 RepID=UPI00129ECBFA|nr:non-specific lipid-transfer protein 1-like [Nymphaea colorata]